ncbi:hypothetical protein ACOMHN_039602 [Nucella lapillus]
MGGACTSEVGPSTDPNLIIDVQKVLEDSTWNVFKIAHGKIERRFLKRKNYEIQVPMHYFHFEVVDTQMSGRVPRQQGSTGLGRPSNGLQSNAAPGVGNAQQASQQKDGGSLLAGKGLANHDKTSPGMIGLETEFNNDTKETQTYTFQFQKVRNASVEVSYQRGYSIGTKANFSIGLPKVFGDGSVGVEVDRHLEITKATGEKFDESLTTSATSNIVVSANSRYVASVIMEERLLMANFTTIVEMSMPALKAPIYVKNLKTGETNFVRTISSLPRIFKDFPAVSKVTNDEGQCRPDAVRFRVDGVIDGVQLSTHRINLHSGPAISKQTRDEEAAKQHPTPPLGTVSEELVVL